MGAELSVCVWLQRESVSMLCYVHRWETLGSPYVGGWLGRWVTARPSHRGIYDAHLFVNSTALLSLVMAVVTFARLTLGNDGTPKLTSKYLTFRLQKQDAKQIMNVVLSGSL